MAAIVAFAVMFVALPSSPDPVGRPANLVAVPAQLAHRQPAVWTLLTLGLGVLWAEAARAAAAALAQNSMPLSAEIPRVVGVLDLAHLGDGVGHLDQLVGGVPPVATTLVRGARSRMAPATSAASTQPYFTGYVTSSSTSRS